MATVQTTSCRSISGFLVLVLALALNACTKRELGTGPTWMLVPDAGVGVVDSGPPGALTPDAHGMNPRPATDPFDPNSACGASKQSTTRVPSTLFFVLDRSGSMDVDVPGSTRTRWEVVRQVVLNLVDSLGDEVNAGMAVFPADDESCSAPRSPQVPLATLGSARARFHSVLAATEPEGSTPLLAGIRLAYGNLDAPDIDPRGQRAVVVLTDGGESCEDSARVEASVLAMTDARRAQGVLTFAVGLDEQNTFLSQLAHRGGTSRTPDCNASCSATSYGRRCTRSSECPMGGLCRAGSCIGGGTASNVCCNYSAGSAELETEFQAALTRITDQILRECIFDAPRPGNGATAFDPSLVNVGVSFRGEPRLVLPQSSDESVNGWHFTDSEAKAIAISGPACERIRQEPSDIEIVYGCPTIIF